MIFIKLFLFKLFDRSFGICEHKGIDLMRGVHIDQMRDNTADDQRLCFRYIDITTSKLPKSESSSLQPYVIIQPR